MAKLIIRVVDANGAKYELTEHRTHPCRYCEYNHPGGEIIVYQRIREGQAGEHSSPKLSLFYRCYFNETDCSDLKKERDRDRSARNPPLGSPDPFRTLLSFFRCHRHETECGIINKEGLEKVIEEIKSKKEIQPKK